MAASSGFSNLMRRIPGPRTKQMQLKKFINYRMIIISALLAQVINTRRDAHVPCSVPRSLSNDEKAEPTKYEKLNVDDAQWSCHFRRLHFRNQFFLLLPFNFEACVSSTVSTRIPSVIKCRLAWKPRTIGATQNACVARRARNLLHSRFDEKGESALQRNGKFIFRILMNASNTHSCGTSLNILSLFIKHLLTLVPFPISIVGVIIRFHIRYIAWRESRSYREISVWSIGGCATIPHGNSGRPFASSGIAKGRTVHTNRQEEHQCQRKF